MFKFENILIAIGIALIAITASFSLYAGYNQASAVSKWDKIISIEIKKRGPAPGVHKKANIGSVDTNGLVDREAVQGASIALLEIPAIDRRFDVLEGATWLNLAKGPVHLSDSALVGSGGTTVVSAHRTMYGAPFRNLDKLAAGDTINIYTKKALFTYRVVGLKSVNPSDMSDITREGKPRLILSTCDPVFSAKQRLLVIGELANAVSLR